jgi:hypothetical protein
VLECISASVKSETTALIIGLWRRARQRVINGSGDSLAWAKSAQQCVPTDPAKLAKSLMECRELPSFKSPQSDSSHIPNAKSR